ncbi:MAG: hypothetical protein KGO96_14170, partial [Elusimicrobia bacterium]|nr:hypothetical protein [Elusimicrobiota bacterium]
RMRRQVFAQGYQEMVGSVSRRRLNLAINLAWITAIAAVFLLGVFADGYADWACGFLIGMSMGYALQKLQRTAGEE